MGTHSNKCLTVTNTTEANATLPVYVSEMYSEGRNKSFFSPLFWRNVLFFFSVLFCTESNSGSLCTGQEARGVMQKGDERR